jgi:Protein of unknown function (DUF3300)
MSFVSLRWKTVLAVLLLVSLVVSPDFAPLALAQAQANTDIPTAQELDQLLAPVALYPDTLLAQITTASTNPQEILDCDTWLKKNSNLTGTALTDAAQAQMFDPAFIALVNFPQVLDMMAQNVDDYAAIGEAFTADQGSVSASIQRLRAQAYSAGTLRTTPQQTVQVQQASGQTVYVVQPANPQIVYVPTYDPTVVYVPPAPGVVVPLVAFGIGIGIGALLVDNRPWGWGGWGWNWGGRRAYYNHGPWGGWGPNPYRPPHYYYRQRPISWRNRPGYGGNWRYRPPNYRPPYRPGRPSTRPGYRPGRPGTRPGYRPPSRRTPSTRRPSTRTPSTRTPSTRTPSKRTPITRTPGTRPSSGSTRPSRSSRTPSRDTSGGTKPSTTRPTTRPAKPTGSSRQPSTHHSSSGGSSNRSSSRSSGSKSQK